MNTLAVLKIEYQDLIDEFPAQKHILERLYIAALTKVMLAPEKENKIIKNTRKAMKKAIKNP